MRRLTRAVLAVVVVLAACTEAPGPSTSPATPSAAFQPIDAIDAQIIALFPAGPLRQQAREQWILITRTVSIASLTPEQTAVIDLVDFVLDTYKANSLLDPNGGAAPTTEEAVSALVDALYIYVGLTPPAIPPDQLVDGDAEVIGPAGGDLIAGSGIAGAQIPPGAVTSNVLFVLTRLPDPAGPGQGPLPTTLDQWGPFFEFHTFPEVTQFAEDVERAICTFDNGTTFSPPDFMHGRLQLAHPDPTNPTQIEFLPKGTSASYLDCSSVVIGDASGLSDEAFDARTHTLGEKARHYALRLGRKASGLVLPNVAYAAHAGLSGISRNFSPHGAVDPLDGATAIDFEKLVDLTPTCATCGLRKQYSSLNVNFRFLATGLPHDSATILLSTALDPVTEPGNHSATAGRNALGNYVNGTFRMLFPVTTPLPTTVSFQLRGPNSVALFPVVAVGALEQSLAANITRTNVHTYLTPGGATWREETITVTFAGGISRVDVGMNGFKTLVDDLIFKP